MFFVVSMQTIYRNDQSATLKDHSMRTMNALVKRAGIAGSTMQVLPRDSLILPSSGVERLVSRVAPNWKSPLLTG
jgi:hypothetical protein